MDIAVDLKGYTGDARPGVFAYRAAPVQVNYLAYPGTLGADCFDYLIADSTLVPPEDQAHYSEKIVCLPHGYQPNDRTRPIASRVLSRAEAGLPENGFVFCCFNNSFKIGPETFDLWMEILAQVDGSVLWLLQDSATAEKNLRSEARRRGVARQRLIFAPRMALPDHLARHALADLFLDTLPYSAHTTASDALWADLPVLTRRGATFAGRVSASVLEAIGLTELVTTSAKSYVDVAIALAAKPNELSQIRQRLAASRQTAPLFDIALFTKNIERGFAAMYDRCQARLPANHLTL
jgi:predicted O-linked N-acetylglucosamine transferase (SPINDLY family)